MGRRRRLYGKGKRVHKANCQRQARAESPTSPQPRATPWVPCSSSLRPVRAKVKINHSPLLLPLQGVSVYTLIPRALPWAVNWLPFQGAPSRALFVYHVRMLRHLRLAQYRPKIFLYSKHPIYQNCFIITNCLSFSRKHLF